MRRLDILVLLTTASILLTASLGAEEYNIELKNPTFSRGVLSTDEGGIISGDDLRIQALHLSYISKVENGIEIKHVSAKGDLLLEYQHQVFVGDELEYDLIRKIGTLKKGRTTTEYWFVGGEELQILSDGSFWISNAYMTTVEGQNAWWQLNSSTIKINHSSLLSARNVKINFLDIPIFWLPKFKFDLNWVKDTPIRYKFIWDQVLKQKVSMRYELYSTETFSLFGRLDYRFKKGPGAAIETDYLSQDQTTLFQTKSYGAFDKIVPDETGNKRYRLQGLLTSRLRDDKTKFYLSYDKLSDDKMPQDFKDSDFEVNTQKRTITWLSHQTNSAVSRIAIQPRINSFQSINQELPLITLGLKPFPLGNSKIIFQNQFSAGYLNYIYADGLSHILPSSRSARLDTRNTLHRRFSIGNINWTPWIGLIGTFYSNTPQQHATGQAIGSYGFYLNTNLYRPYQAFVHGIEPYLELNGLTQPTTPSYDHYIFSIDDGLARQVLFRPGIKQTFYLFKKPLIPMITLDLYTQVFAGKTAFHRAVPKIYWTTDFRYPSWLISTDLVYNLQEKLFDRTNIRSAWTLSENAAFTLEFRHRSKYDWRKSNYTNYIVDIERSIEDLLLSPLSDGRNTILSKYQFRFSPLWTCHIESHIGTGRKDEPNYYAYEIKLRTILTGRWEMEVGYKYSPSTRQWIFPSFKLLNARF